ncbi:preprotein translocase subunit SecG [Macrococcus armenti]|uniref:preprotein translocase subunit SecG n=1 Tax=Macrococcus armenti TaxID=2875764 RepID=UPI001CCCEFAE|nr:preprotein translocase subunit SecG [Macrococcus armenti]UBH15969.1 preprotein translocase subunit SecG [Macrococcus armenti]UBH18330.1 preprotein translocase subunit SecG [Macrococcus armenti]UBH20596.1 preprotein translocase subunit SecG [Macrococcus armenti]UBH22936.1 preprotein translocase subunit SecG [Macrococcus armenti]
MNTILTILLIIDCFVLITVVLLQEGKSSGLSGAISGGSETLFGKQKQRGVELILNRITIVASVLLFLITIAIGYFNI